MSSDQLSLFTDPEPACDETFARVERLWLDETSWVEIVQGWVTGGDTLLRRLAATAPFEQRRRWIYNEQVAEPRLTAEYRDVTAVPDPFLVTLSGALSRHYGVAYDGLWMNLYRDHRDSTGWHGDRATCKRAECVVPVLSLGATRRFHLKSRAGGSSTVLVPTSGDLVVMGGRCQTDWRHCVPKQARPAGPRISINFSSTAQAEP